ncbi:MAG TPA: hypothetical protein VLE20_00825 [Blastocatellia bacterium]|nr:hypothetical protein [Blastocatellia bacterium]
MENMKIARLFMVFLFSLSLLTLDSPVQAQAPKSADDQRLIKALLDEVRLLRQAFQRLNLNAYRSQILVERIRAQNDKVARLTRSVEDARDEMAETLISANQLNERVKSTESMIENESNAKQREQMEAELKYMLDVHKQREQRLREREQRLSEQLRVEQVKLDEFESRLDALEREITIEIQRQESEDTTRDRKKPQ